VLGLALAWWVLNRTVAEGRRQARHSGAMETAARLSTLTVTLAQDLNARIKSVPAATATDLVADWWKQVREIQALALELWARTHGDWPRFAEVVDAQRRDLIAAMSPSPKPILDRADEIITQLGTVGSVATIWLEDPSAFERRTRNRTLRPFGRAGPAK
jgi:hypothetical protein